jgi:eukaryotic-like serine/threonine-protein kinase
VGKSLPTIYHWATAASPWGSASIVPASNFGGQGPARVGTYHGMSWFGAYDMGGNVKEWCWNDAGSGKRYILGASWDEPVYMFTDGDARFRPSKEVRALINNSAVSSKEPALV